MKSIYARVQRLNWLLIAIMLVGLGLRLWGIDFGLPYTYAADEPSRMGVSLAMLKTGDLNPHWLGYPHLAFYLNTIAYFLYFLVGRIAGIFATPADIPYPEVITIGVGKLAMPSEFLVGRSLTALMSVGAVMLVYLIGRQLSNQKTVAFLAALLFAISPAAVANSKFISLDAYGVFFLLLAFYWINCLLDDPTPRRYILAGIGVGLAVSGKYNVGVIILALFVAHGLNFGIAGFWRKGIYLALLAGGLAFAVVNPFSVLDPGGFLYGLTLASGSQSQYSGIRESGFLWYGLYLWNVEGLVVIPASIQAIRILVTRSKPGWVLLSFPVAYFILVSMFSVHNDRTILPIIPFLDLLASLFVANLYEWLIHAGLLPRRVLQAGVIALSALLIFPPLQTTIAANIRLTQVDSRETARRWIDSILPPGTRIAVEGYSTYVDIHRFEVQGTDTIISHSPDWYVNNGFEYLVTSQGIYGRFFADPQSYAGSVQTYEQFFSRFPTVKLFDDNGYEIHIQKTNAILPAHRIAARFGNQGELIELVGFDDAPQKWMQGQPLQVKLTWRTIEQKIEPFEVELRLLDKDNREVGRMRGDLFQGKGWQDGMFSTDWTIPAQETAAPGVYHLEVNVIESRYAYQTPAQTWAGGTLDRVILGPIKMSVLPPTAIELQNMRQAGVQFGNSIGLLGYLATTNTHAGVSLPLTLYWQSLAKPPRDYTVFVHLVDANGKIVAQVDTQARGGAYSTSVWDASEIIRDDYALQLPADLAPGSYRIEIGLYEYPSLTRLAIANAQGNLSGDHWVLPDAIQVVQ